MKLIIKEEMRETNFRTGKQKIKKAERKFQMIFPSATKFFVRHSTLRKEQNIIRIISIIGRWSTAKAQRKKQIS